jgi:sugar fermentation stimulation protein A
MKYSDITQAEFLTRENRFIATVKIGDKIERVHVKNTGRCRELLVEGATVYLEKGREGRKTPYDLVAVEKETERGRLLINMDSFAPNLMVGEWLSGGLFSKSAKVRAEYKYGMSRVDFYIEDGERRALVEVKGVTLENGGIARFPDAPTERGRKHLGELIGAIDEGYEAYVIFVIQMKGVTRFEPNRDTDPEFARLLSECQKRGVKVLAYECEVVPGSAVITHPVSVYLC